MLLGMCKNKTEANNLHGKVGGSVILTSEQKGDWSRVVTYS